MKPVRISTDGLSTRIEVDGVDIASATRSAVLQVVKGAPPRLMVELDSTAEWSGEAEVVLKGATMPADWIRGFVKSSEFRARVDAAYGDASYDEHIADIVLGVLADVAEGSTRVVHDGP